MKFDVKNMLLMTVFIVVALLAVKWLGTQIPVVGQITEKL